MNREIKFRGRRVDTGEWVCGYYYHDQKFKNGYSCQDVYIIRDELDQDFEVDPATVGQFTGFKDKNGQEIYEGDILRYILFQPIEGVTDNELLHQVIWAENGFYFWRYKTGYMEDPENPHGVTNGYKVSGNIYENLELLKEEKICDD